MKAKRRLRFIAPVVAVALVALVVLIPRRHVQLYKVTVLPSLAGTMTKPLAINDHGQVAGIADVAGRQHLILWDRDNGTQDLGPAQPGRVDINNAGQIAATMTGRNGQSRAFLWDPDNGKQMLGTLGGGHSVALALNNNGQVVGYSDSAEGTPQPFAWDKTNGMRELERAGQQAGMATAISDDGQVLGSMGHRVDPSKAYFWASTEAAPRSAPLLQSPFNYSGGSDLNDNGYLLGRTFHWDKRGMWVFLWTNKRDVEDIEYLFPLEHSAGPLRINDANQVLYGERHTSSLARISKKYFRPYTQRCLRDQKHGMIVLDKQVPHKIGKLLRVEDINNHGCIVGIVRSKGLGQELAVLLEPIPERWGK